jgi:DNA mismatch repair ATPase MutS
MFATHFHEMTELAADFPSVKNLYCDAMAEDGQFTLLYNVLPGTCKKSFGIDVAKLAGFPSEVLEEARQHLDMFEKSMRFVHNAEAVGKMTNLLESFENAQSEDERKRLRGEAETLAHNHSSYSQ